MKKKFDCVAMKRAGSRLIYEKIKNMTPQQELAYWQECHRELEKEKQTAEAKQAHAVK
jgi:hypothetical protein